MYDNIGELKVHFESKLGLIQWLDEKDWIKSLCIKYVTYIFSMAIRPHVCGSSHITKPKKNEKWIQCPSIKSPPFFKGNGFYAFIVQEVQKNTFF